MKVPNNFAALKLKMLNTLWRRRGLRRQEGKMIAIKEGARVHGVGTEMILATLIVSQVFREYGSPCVITSGIDGEHSWSSEHNKGDALDYRIWYLRQDQLEDAVEKMKERLGEDYDVVLHTTHIHVEFDPKRGY